MTNDKLISSTDAWRLARKAYYALIEDIAKQQKRLVEIVQLRRTFGDKALPPDTLLRSNTNTMADARDKMQRIEAQTKHSLEDNYRLVCFLEEMFRKQDDADMEAFAQMMRDRYRKDTVSP